MSYVTISREHVLRDNIKRTCPTSQYQENMSYVTISREHVLRDNIKRTCSPGQRQSYSTYCCVISAEIAATLLAMNPIEDIALLETSESTSVTYCIQKLFACKKENCS